uniref:Protein lin-10 n=1 Tax=Macrostomum lignano TaxID=282301 RepID=A0A1I8JIG0_9PLAT
RLPTSLAAVNDKITFCEQKCAYRVKVSDYTTGTSSNQRFSSFATVLIEGLLFRALYLGSTQLVTEGQPGKAARMTQAQEAVNRVKAPDGEQQPCVPVDLFISKEKILVLNANLQEIMMDHALKTVAYIADIGNLLVFMARRRLLHSPEKKQARVVCHVFETDELISHTAPPTQAGLVAQSIGQAFQSAYLEFLRANGVDRPHRRELREAAYQDVLEAQDLLGEELALFSRPETQKEVLVPKAKGEPLGVVVVESGWGSLLPTAVLANMQPAGPAARCAQLNIGDQLLAVNGVSLVGLPLSTCQQLLKACRPRTAVKLSLVSCPPVVQVLYVQNGVICSLLRGGIAERGGVRVGHRIIEINGQSVVATPHDKIVSMLASGVGEIHMKTMPTSVFRLLTGQETPHYI